jgi:K+-transporting ATPase KdpF subunit
MVPARARGHVEATMTMVTWLAGVLGALLLAYLFVALLFPEKLS